MRKFLPYGAVALTLAAGTMVGDAWPRVEDGSREPTVAQGWRPTDTALSLTVAREGRAVSEGYVHWRSDEAEDYRPPDDGYGKSLFSRDPSEIY